MQKLNRVLLSALILGALNTKTVTVQEAAFMKTLEACVNQESPKACLQWELDSMTTAAAKKASLPDASENDQDSKLTQKLAVILETSNDQMNPEEKEALKEQIRALFAAEIAPAAPVVTEEVVTPVATEDVVAPVATEERTTIDTARAMHYETLHSDIESLDKLNDKTIVEAFLHNLNPEPTPVVETTEDVVAPVTTEEPTPVVETTEDVVLPVTTEEPTPVVETTEDVVLPVTTEEPTPVVETTEDVVVPVTTEEPTPVVETTEDVVAPVTTEEPTPVVETTEDVVAPVTTEEPTPVVETTEDVVAPVTTEEPTPVVETTEDVVVPVTTEDITDADQQ